MSSAITFPTAGPGAADRPTTMGHPAQVTEPEMSTALDGLLIEDLSEESLRVPPPGICICTVAAR
ncbi:hypothetical protein [Streptomyces sp. NPDC018031]|uniref:hypothetical protein n=1 Tax=Streptomyces sp. NPDC018031 TaxID=3365033 RepID=UPI0037A151F8